MGYCFLDICMFHLGPSPDLDRFQVSQKPLQAQTHGFQGWPDGGFMKPKQPIRYQPSADVNRDVSRFFRKGKTVNPNGHQSNVFRALKYDILHSIWAALSENCALCIFFYYSLHKLNHVIVSFRKYRVIKVDSSVNGFSKCLKKEFLGTQKSKKAQADDCSPC